MAGETGLSMTPIASLASPLLDPFINPALDSLHGFHTNGLNPFADEPLKILFDGEPCLLFKQEQQRIDLNLHQGQGGRNCGNGFVVHVCLHGVNAFAILQWERRSEANGRC